MEDKDAYKNRRVDIVKDIKDVFDEISDISQNIANIEAEMRDICEKSQGRVDEMNRVIDEVCRAYKYDRSQIENYCIETLSIDIDKEVENAIEEAALNQASKNSDFSTIRMSKKGKDFILV